MLNTISYKLNKLYLNKCNQLTVHHNTSSMTVCEQQTFTLPCSPNMLVKGNEPTFKEVNSILLIFDSCFKVGNFQRKEFSPEGRKLFPLKVVPILEKVKILGALIPVSEIQAKLIHVSKS